MKTQFTTITGYGIVLLLSSFTIYPIYAVSNDKNLFLNVSKTLQDTKQKTTIKLSGTVKDSFGALGGVIVTVGTTVVTTDLNGKYTIDITSGDKITFSMIGYKDQSIVYTKGNVLNITLSEDSSTLDEIVVNAGYYSVKDRERTGSIARVTAKDIEFQPVTNPLQAIQGRMAGVSITQNSGVPGGGFDIQIRGRNSLRSMANSTIDGNAPLYVINGVPFSDSNMSDSDLSIGILPMRNVNPLNSINPNDIESIEILKDADATAIYGSRGANGVILVTTKKNQKDKTSFTLSSSTAFSKVANFAKLMNTEQFNQMREQAFKNDNITTFPIYAYDMNGTWDKNRYTDWQKELIGGTAISKNISFGVSGGSENTHFLINANHNEDTTVFPTDSGYKRNTFFINLNHKSKDNKLQINSSTNYAIQSNNLISTDLTKQALILAPNAPSLYKEDGGLNWDFGIYGNPIAPNQATYKYDSNNLVINLDLSYNVFKNTLFKINTGLTNTHFEEKLLTPHTIHDPAKKYTSEQSKAENSTKNSMSYIVEPQLNWSTIIGDKLSINVLIGSTYQENTSNSMRISGSNFPSNALISNIAAAKTKTIKQTGNLQYKYLAFFGRLNFTYNQKYIINLTGRRDGSSRFGDNNRFGNFGAIGTAWIFSEEKLLKSLSWLNHAKLRASYGTSGSDNIGNYQYLDTYSLNMSSYANTTGLSPSRLYNPNFSWEKTNKLETAIEFSLLQERLNTTISWYKNRSSNQLVGIPLPSTTGFPSIQDNLNATIENKGWEFTLNTTNIFSRNFSWRTNFNISFPKNTLLDFPNLEGSTYANQFEVGKSTNIRKLYNFKGVDPVTGLYVFTDYNKDGKINTQDKQSIKELGIKYHGGLQNTLTYKQFNLDFLFQFVKQNSYNYNNNLNTPGSIRNQPLEMLNSWSPTNPNSNYAFYTTGMNNDLNDATEFFRQSNQTISDASYIRLKNISLSYMIKLPNTKLNSFRLYFQGQNLWTVTNYFGIDPEFTVIGFLPPLKTYSFGVELIF